MDDQIYQTVTAAARMLGLPETWLRRQVHDGELPAVRAGRRILLDPDEIRRLLNERAAGEEAAR